MVISLISTADTYLAAFCRGRRASLMLAYVLVLAQPTAMAMAGAMFRGLGDLPGGTFQSAATGVSADGSTVVGWSVSASGSAGFYWTAETGMIDLRSLGDMTRANAISANGAVIVGERDAGGNPLPRSYQIGSGLVGLGSLGNWGYAYGVSGDGSVTVGNYGWVPSPPPTYFGFRTTGAKTRLTGKNGGEAEAYSVSADGQKVVGTAWTVVGDNGWYEATIWDGDWTSGTMVGQGLGRLGNSYSAALAISADGTTIVGNSGNQAVRFTPGVLVGLGYLPGAYGSNATAVSADGSVIVGWSQNPSRAFVWDESHGIRDLKQALETEASLDLSGWTLNAATGVSADGRTFVGYGRNPQGGAEAWVATVPEPSTFALLAAGGIVFAGWVRRRRKQ